MNTQAIKLAEALENIEENIAQMQAMPDKVLAKNLSIIQMQIETANKLGKQKAIELLQEYERQIIEARVLKLDAPKELPENEVLQTKQSKTKNKSKKINIELNKDTKIENLTALPILKLIKMGKELYMNYSEAHDKGIDEMANLYWSLYLLVDEAVEMKME